MPLPKPKPGEERSDWISRCMGNPTMLSEFHENDQRMAVCVSQWDEAQKMARNNSLLVKAIRERGEKQTEFSYGILTADRWVKNMQQIVGLDTCYKYAARNNVSFDDTLKKAAQTLTYSNQDMLVEQKEIALQELKGITLPKHTLMAFKHVLTTPRKDRDGDVLRTEGAIVDPKMLLLWQHVHTLPIGKMLAVVDQNPKKLTLISAIVDMNELSHDAAVMVENDMARFSHGFRALEFEELKETEDDMGIPGFDVKRFEVMEESMVSVPSNADAEVSEVLVSLVERGKLTSGIMKEYGKTLRSQMPVLITSGIDLRGENHESDGNGSTSEKAGQEGKASSPKESEAVPKEEQKGSDDKEVEEVEKEISNALEAALLIEPVKQGRTLSKKNKEMLQEVHDDLAEMKAKDAGMSRGSMAMCERCMEKLKTVIGTDENLETTEEFTSIQEVTVKEAMAIFIAQSNEQEKTTMLSALQVMKVANEQESKAKQFMALVGH